MLEFDVAFASEAGALLIEGVLLCAGGFAFGFEVGELLVKVFEEAGDVGMLGAEAVAGATDDGRVEAEARGGLDARAGAGDAETEDGRWAEG